jgi:hypothetical protein
MEARRRAVLDSGMAAIVDTVLARFFTSASLEWPDTKEMLLQTAGYAGVPAANTGFQIASEKRAHVAQGFSPANPAGRPKGLHYIPFPAAAVRCRSSPTPFV